MSEQETKLSPINQFKKQLSDFEPEVKKLLPEHISPERFTRVVLLAVTQNAELLEAERKSFFNACLKCASDGLLPDGRESTLQIYKLKDGTKQCQYMPMVGGLIKKMRNSGEIQTITSNLVYEKDHFEYRVDGDGETFIHKPEVFKPRGEAIGVYCMVKTKDGGLFFEILSKDQVMAVKAASKSGGSNFSPWNGAFWSEMWRKTALRRLSKRLPMSAEVENVFKNDNEDYDFQQAAIQSKSAQVAALIQANKVEELPEPVTPIESEVPQVESKKEEAGSFASFTAYGKIAALDASETKVENE